MKNRNCLITTKTIGSCQMIVLSIVGIDKLYIYIYIYIIRELITALEYCKTNFVQL